MTTTDQIAYDNALKRVRKIKGFYTHLIVYIVINIMIIVLNTQNLKPGESYFQWNNFATALFWGIGLAAHGLSVFIPAIVLGRDWEELKIKELMEKQKNGNWE
ncbi:2TM domain-containing protein [Flavobacterium glaciei]|uniref:2TM domain-containing protein n=1 Tax=Flavobacterium glaciei TaxID=386300 RepID=A0A562Q1W1_9FLAO|nr:2TM domain-containing protein [Flavobacterium glaciei]RDI57547.1 2TM domain-containing protein [Flavobacterium glaciei]TWI50652.1 2TM domain-containing protein [Flavobacterium glaciei]